MTGRNSKASIKKTNDVSLKRLCRSNGTKIAGRMLVERLLKAINGETAAVGSIQDVEMVEAQPTTLEISNEEDHSVEDEDEDANDVEEEINEPASDTEEDHFHQSEAGINNKHKKL